MSKSNDLMMTRDEIEQSLRSTMAIQARRRLERKLAESLALAMNLSKGTGLVMCLGDGRETSNVEALTTWVGETLKLMGLEPNRSAIPPLLVELERTLMAWEGQAWQ
ncbi:hypothetical protein OR573_15495 [Halomonas sp. CH40]